MPKVSAEHADARKRQIVDAALRRFSEQGFHRTTMKDIIAESGMSAGAIYNYFGSKDEIIDEIARERHARENAILSGAIAGEEGLPGLRQLVAAFFDSFASPEHMATRRVGIEVWAEALRNPDVLKTVRRGVDEPREILERVMLQSQARGEIPSHVDIAALARVGVALFQGFVLQRAWDSEVDAKSYMRAVEALLDGLAADAATE